MSTKSSDPSPDKSMPLLDLKYSTTAGMDNPIPAATVANGTNAAAGPTI